MFNNWFRNFNIWLLCTHTKAPLWELSVSLYLCFPSCDVFAVLIGHEGYFKAEGSVFHSLFLIGETLSLIKTCGPVESQLQATADLSGWGKGGQVDFQMHTLPGIITSRIWELAREGKKEAWTITATVRCWDYYGMIYVGTEQWPFSQSDVDLAAQIN